VIVVARKPRIHYEGALYHVMVRGNNRSESLKYLWSSHLECMGIPELADVNFPCSLFDTHKKKAIKRYLTFMDGMETKVIGSMNKEEEEIEEIRNMKGSPKVASDTLIKIIEEVTKIDIEKIKGNSKSKRISDIRKLYMNKLKKVHRYNK
jgi:hypothetical protein